jgi:hypothetical protein
MGIPSFALAVLRSIAFLLRSARGVDQPFAAVIPAAIAGLFRAFPNNPVVPEELRNALAVLRKRPRAVQQSIISELVVAIETSRTVVGAAILREITADGLESVVARFVERPNAENGRMVVEVALQNGMSKEALRMLVEAVGGLDGGLLVVFAVCKKLAHDTQLADAIPRLSGRRGDALAMALAGADIGDALDYALGGE